MNNFANFSAKPYFELAQTFTVTMEKIVRANLEAVSHISKACLEACHSCCKVAEEASAANNSAKATSK